MSDYYRYRQKIEQQRRRRNAVVALLVVLVFLCAAAGLFWMTRPGSKQDTQPAAASTASAETAAAATAAPTAATAEQAAAGPRRLLPAIENAAWDTSQAVEQTIDFDYLNTDSRMAGLPALGRADRSHFDTVTFLGDSITEGMECYATGYQNAHVCAYRGAGPEVVVNNATVKDYIRNVTEPAFDSVVATQPDALYILFGTNSMVSTGNEDTFLAYYERMIDMLQESLPNVPIYIQSIPGVQEWVKDTKPGLDNDRIRTVNDLLANLALRKGCYFVNIAEALNQADGSQIDEYEADGIHMQPVGYAAWCDYLATHTAWDRRNTYTGPDPLYILGS